MEGWQSLADCTSLETEFLNFENINEYSIYRLFN